MKSLISFDPGGTTGYALFSFSDTEPLKLVAPGQIPGGVTGFIAQATPLGVKGFDVVVSESFALDGRTPKPDVTPLRIEGAMLAIRAAAGQAPPIFQRNTYKVHAPDALLKEHGLYQRGMPHANDAIRHAIAWAKTSRHRPTIEWLWPVPAGLLVD